MNYHKFIILAAATIFIQSCGNTVAKDKSTADHLLPAIKYVCLPCGRSCDLLVLEKTGFCAECNMELVDKETVVFSNLLPKDLYSHILKTGSGNYLLLDVRTPEEFNGTAEEKFGRLRNAINIPVQQLEARIDELKPFMQKEIIVYCSHSHRSPAASYLLTQKGFTKVTNLQYGMHVWKQQVTDELSNETLYISQ